MDQQLGATGGIAAGRVARLGLEGVKHQLAQLLVRLEGMHPVHELCLQGVRLDHRLFAVAVIAAGRTLVATDTCTRSAGAVHPCAALIAAQELAQEIALGRAAGLDDARAPSANFLHAVEQLIADDRLVQSLDRTGLVAKAAHVSGVGGVAQHLPHGVLTELAIASGTRAGCVQPCGERAVGLLAGGVTLEQSEHERRAPWIGSRELGVGVADVAPREAADQMALAGLLA
ncbi:MAG TPA: hypothetical protein VK730_02155 [Solirubrobacteraceae bacterium]|nr:hypothetical protein [Solirubrobacteraceae bacterium]